MATMIALRELVRSVAPAGVSIEQAAQHLGCHYRAAASLISHAHSGRSLTLRLHHVRHGHSGLYFEREDHAKAFDIAAYDAARFAVPKPTRAPMQAKMYEFVSEQPRGATQEQIRIHAGCSVDHATAVISQMVKNGRLIAIGPNCWKRYFTDAALVAEIGADVLAEIERTRMANKVATRAKKNAAKREKWAASAALRPKPATKPKANVTIKNEPQRSKFMIEPRRIVKAGQKLTDQNAPAPAVLFNERKLPKPKVTLAPCVAWMQKKRVPDCEPTIPPHVKVQVCPGYQGHLRFAPDPGRVIGGFATMGIGRYLDEQVAA